MPLLPNQALSASRDTPAKFAASIIPVMLRRMRELGARSDEIEARLVGGASMFTLWVTARPGVTPETIEAATLAEIDRLASDGPTEADLERVRNLHAAHAAGALERISERADRLSMYA